MRSFAVMSAGAVSVKKSSGISGKRIFWAAVATTGFAWLLYWCVWALTTWLPDDWTNWFTFGWWTAVVIFALWAGSSSTSEDDPTGFLSFGLVLFVGFFINFMLYALIWALKEPVVRLLTFLSSLPWVFGRPEFWITVVIAVAALLKWLFSSPPSVSQQAPVPVP
jgi:hypothetical protein